VLHQAPRGQQPRRRHATEPDGGEDVDRHRQVGVRVDPLRRGPVGPTFEPVGAALVAVGVVDRDGEGALDVVGPCRERSRHVEQTGVERRADPGPRAQRIDEELGEGVVRRSPPGDDLLREVDVAHVLPQRGLGLGVRGDELAQLHLPCRQRLLEAVLDPVAGVPTPGHVDEPARGRAVTPRRWVHQDRHPPRELVAVDAAGAELAEPLEDGGPARRGFLRGGRLDQPAVDRIAEGGAPLDAVHTPGAVTPNPKRP
jgi:hypothetical protein